MTASAAPKSELVLYQAEYGRTRTKCRFESETIRLTETHLAPSVGLRSAEASVIHAKHVASEVA
jgi:hypothetical protein